MSGLGPRAPPGYTEYLGPQFLVGTSTCLTRNSLQAHFWRANPAVGSRGREVRRCNGYVLPLIGVPPKVSERNGVWTEGLIPISTIYQAEKSGGATKPATIHSSYGGPTCSCAPNYLSAVVRGLGGGQGILSGPTELTFPLGFQ